MRCLPLTALLPLLLTSAALAHADAAPLRWRNSLQPRGKAPVSLTLASAGATAYSIVVPASPTPQDTRAADDLAKYLGQMTGATFPILSDATPARPTEISVGRTNRLAGRSLPQLRANLGDEGYAIAVSGKRLFLLGGRKRGAINAAYALLEEDLGCRWYDRGNARVPRRPILTFAPVPRSFVPRLFIRDPFYWDAFDGEWSLHNRTNAPSAAVPEELGGHVDYDGLFVHTFNTLVPPGEYFASHPEYFMFNGERRITQQLCLTNPDVVRIATANLLTILQRSPNTEIVEVSPNDGGMHCLCPACKAIDDANASPSGTLITFVNQIAEAVEKVRPDVRVSTLAYLDIVDAPKIVRPRDNVVIRLCNDLHSWRYPFTCFATDNKPESIRYRNAITGWAKIGAHLTIWDYFVNFSHYSGPMPNMDVLAPSVDFYLANNVRGIMMQAAYQGPGGEFAPLRSWVMAKLLWDPSLSVPALVDDFLAGYYREASGEIRAYWDLLYAAKAAHMDTMAAPPEGIRYGMSSPFLSADLLNQATALFTRAHERCHSQQLRDRVDLAYLPVLYTQLCQGPKTWGAQFPELLARFESIARKNNVAYLREGGPDLDEKLNGWRDDARVQSQISSIRADEVTVVPLENEWKFATDPQDAGVAGGWFAPAFNDSVWATVRSDIDKGWESQGFRDYTGYGWYRQRAAVPASVPGKHVYLYFGAVDEDAEVWLNGQKVCTHTCDSTGLAPEQIWMTPFICDVKPFLRPGQDNVLAVRVLNRMGMGGVYKPVQAVMSDRELDAPLITALLQRP